ncbi:hypothetical protein LOD99_13753 [Oopsacas minuta]|uniref:Large ribosomal subunit protein bL28m n=1 Tax=Oopsacas minuta TaxID=111878 RepID=A0AAV7KMX1_9METZ|nr:hypothetical protein LOD99_13753 [Oopsacas minuta]
MAGVWRGFHFSRKKFLLKFPKLIPDQKIPVEVRRDPDLGLHGTKRVMHGYYVTHTNKRMRRIWRPNIVLKTCHSDILNHTFTFPVAADVVRLMDKAGSLDAYILYTDHRRLGGKFAIDFHYKLLEVISNNLDIKLPPKIRYYPKPPTVLMEKVSKIMEEKKASAVANNATPEELIALDYSSMVT